MLTVTKVSKSRLAPTGRKHPDKVHASFLRQAIKAKEEGVRTESNSRGGSSRVALKAPRNGSAKTHTVPVNSGVLP